MSTDKGEFGGRWYYRWGHRFFGYISVIPIKIIESSNKQRQMRQQQQQVVVVQSNPVSQPLQNPSNVIHNVTYNIHDSAIAGDINVGLSEQDGRLNQ